MKNDVCALRMLSVTCEAKDSGAFNELGGVDASFAECMRASFGSLGEVFGTRVQL